MKSVMFITSDIRHWDNSVSRPRGTIYFLNALTPDFVLANAMFSSKEERAAAIERAQIMIDATFRDTTDDQLRHAGIDPLNLEVRSNGK